VLRHGRTTRKIDGWQSFGETLPGQITIDLGT
jgi:hypothetical protein